MGQGFQFFDIIFLAMIAVFVLLRLRNVLGTRTGHEKPPEDLRSRQSGPITGKPEGAVISLPRRGGPNSADAPLSPAEIRLRQALTEIALADPHFDADEFTGGARHAYEMIITGFAKGDRELLRNMVGEEVFINFDAAITARQAAGQVMETRLAKITGARITHAALRGAIAEVTVRFDADLISCVKDSAGELVQGHPTLPQQVLEAWTFCRDTSSDDPNWTLIATAPDTISDATDAAPQG